MKKHIQLIDKSTGKKLAIISMRRLKNHRLGDQVKIGYDLEALWDMENGEEYLRYLKGDLIARFKLAAFTEKNWDAYFPSWRSRRPTFV